MSDSVISWLWGWYDGAMGPLGQGQPSWNLPGVNDVGVLSSWVDSHLRLKVNHFDGCGGWVGWLVDWNIGLPPIRTRT